MITRGTFAAVSFVGVIIGVVVAGSVIPARVPDSDPWALKSGSDRLHDLAIAEARAVPTCGPGIARKENIAWVFAPPPGYSCEGVATYTGVEKTTYCGGGILISDPIGGSCVESDCDPLVWMQNVPPNTTCNGSCCMQAPWAIEEGVICESTCPKLQEPCCPGGKRDCPTCVAKPVFLPNADLAYEFPVFDFAEGFGFPKRFSVHWSQTDSTRRGFDGDPLGYHASHTFSLYLTKTRNSVGQAVARISIEDGAVESFVWNGTSWDPEAGGPATLVAGAPQVCLPEAVLNLTGTIYKFSDYCTGEAAEGQPRRIERPNGDYLDFVTSATGQLKEVRNRRGSAVLFEYGPFQEQEAWGLLSAVKSPGDDRFVFETLNGHLTKILAPNDAPLWTITVNDTEPLAGTLVRVNDAAGKVEHEWTWQVGSDDQPVLATEAGPGSDPLSTVTFADEPGDAASLTFRPAGSATDVTNTYYWTQGPRPRVSKRTLAGSCPNCGDKSMLDRTFWSGVPDGAAHVRVAADAHDVAIVFEDLNASGTEQEKYDASYDALGNPLVVNTGCKVPAAWPDSGSPDCTGARRETFTYRANTDEIETHTEPSVVAGAFKTTTRTFVEGSIAILSSVRVSGRTATVLDGGLGATRTRRTDYVYAANGVDISAIRGPYWDEDGFDPERDPYTAYSYCSVGFPDSCGLSNDYNAGRLRKITRSVTPDSALRTHITYFCNYDKAGRPGRISNELGQGTSLLYNWRGQITQQVVDAGGPPLVTDMEYDANGNLVKLRLPNTAPGGNRAGVLYTYDDADNMVRIDRGEFTSTSFTPLESILYDYDQWGNRILVEVFAGANLEQSESSKYDAFNRLSCVARPASSLACNDPALVTETSYFYDALGNLTSVADSQGDEVKYGSVESLNFLSQYDRFNKITRVSQEVCAHPDPNGTCANPTPADVDYEYDPALQLSAVTVKNPSRSGEIVTSYTTDDFGNVVQIASPDSGTSSFRYDAAGRLIESKDARQKKFEYAYDRLGRLTEKRNTTSGTPVTEVKYCYDGYNAACGFSDSPASTGLVTAVDDKAGAVKYIYDQAGRLIEESRNFGGSQFVTTYAYDPNGNVTDTTYPNGLTIRRTYNLADRETSISWIAGAGSGAIVPGMSWYAFGGLKSWSWVPYGLHEVVVQDDAGRITAVELRDISSNPIESIAYAYANDGNVSELPATVPTPNILHDSLSRITQDRANVGGTTVQSISYDEAGNRVSRNGVSYAYESSANNRLLTAEGKTYQFDVAGNVTSFTGVTAITTADDGTVTGIETASGQTTYTRDYRNLRLTKAGAGGSGTFFYSPHGDLVQWTGPKYHGGNEGHCAQQNEVAEITPYENYVYAGGRRLANLRSRFFDCPISDDVLVIDNLYYYVSDKMDVPRAVYQASNNAKIWSAEFDAFGNPLGFVNEDPDSNCVYFSQPFRLPGQYALSPSEGGPTSTTGGLHENWNRIYGSTIGRYLQPDPIGLYRVGGAVAPNSLYGYGDAQPLTQIDPEGLTAYDKSCAAYKVQLKQAVQRAIDYAKNCSKCGQDGGPFPQRLKNATIYCDKEKSINCGYLGKPFPGRPGGQTATVNDITFTPNGLSGTGSCGCLEATLLHEAAHGLGYAHTSEPYTAQDFEKCTPCAPFKKPMPGGPVFQF